MSYIIIKTKAGGGVMIKLEPRMAIALTKKEWKELLNFPTDCAHCWDPEYVFEIDRLKRTGANEYFITGAVDAPYARVFVFGVYDVPDLIIDWQKRAVLNALKEHKDFCKLLNRYGIARIVWAFADMFDKVRDRKYPTFYVVINDSKSTIEIPQSLE
jgi:hypothetical protein